MAGICRKLVTLQSKLSISIDMAVRNVQLDITRGIAIVLMIIGHCSLFGGTTRYMIFSFHLISGILATNNKTRFLATFGVYSLEILCVHFLVMRVCDIMDCSSHSLTFFIVNITIPFVLPLAYYKLKLGKIYG